MKAVCRHLAGSDLEGESLLASIADALNVYFNYTGNTKCFNSSQQSTTSMSDEGWDFQVRGVFSRLMRNRARFATSRQHS